MDRGRYRELVRDLRQRLEAVEPGNPARTPESEAARRALCQVIRAVLVHRYLGEGSTGLRRRAT